jgi:hypothetical protein
MAEIARLSGNTDLNDLDFRAPADTRAGDEAWYSGAVGRTLTSDYHLCS